MSYITYVNCMLTFKLLAGDHPVPSMDVSLRTLRHTSPFSVMLVCHILVLQITSGGYNEYDQAIIYSDKGLSRVKDTTQKPSN